MELDRPSVAFRTSSEAATLAQLGSRGESLNSSRRERVVQGRPLAAGQRRLLSRRLLRREEARARQPLGHCDASAELRRRPVGHHIAGLLSGANHGSPWVSTWLQASVDIVRVCVARLWSDLAPVEMSLVHYGSVCRRGPLRLALNFAISRRDAMHECVHDDCCLFDLLSASRLYAALDGVQRVSDPVASPVS